MKKKVRYVGYDDLLNPAPFTVEWKKLPGNMWAARINGCNIYVSHRDVSVHIEIIQMSRSVVNVDTYTAKMSIQQIMLEALNLYASMIDKNMILVTGGKWSDEVNYTDPLF